MYCKRPGIIKEVYLICFEWIGLIDVAEMPIECSYGLI